MIHTRGVTPKTSTFILTLLLLIVVAPELFARATPARPRRTLVLRNVTLIDMRAERLQPNMTIVIVRNRITEIGKSPKVPKDAEVFDASGRFLIPGLWDDYTYALEAVKNKFPFFELLLAHGVTGVRDAGTSMDSPEVAKFRTDIEAARILGPRLFYAGSVLQGELPRRRSTRWTGISTIVTTTAAAKRAVETLVGAGADYIKVEKRTQPSILKEIIRIGHKHGVPVVAVPPSFVMDASNDGLDCVEHVAEIFRETSNKRDEYYALYRDGKIDSMTIDQNYAFFGTFETDLPYYETTLKTLARNETYIATNFAQTNTFIGDFELFDASRNRFKTNEQLQVLHVAISERKRQIAENDYRMSETNRKRHLREMADFQRAGVRLLARTQSSSDAVGTAGIILHDELALFVRAGLSPFEALKTATINPARFMRRENDLGTIEPGKLADLVLLDGNPLSDISNTKKINAVVLNGRLLRRSDLDDMLTRAEAAAKAK